MAVDPPGGSVLPPALLASLRRHLPLLVLLPLALVLVVLVHGRPGPASHVSTTSVYISAQAESDARDVNRGALYVQRQIESYAALATSSDVLAPVILDLGLPATPKALARRIDVAPASGAVLKVSVRGGSSKEALALSGAVSASLASRIEAIAPQNDSGAASVSAQVLGSTSFVRTGGYPWMIAGLVAVAGLGLAAGVAIYRFGTGQHIDTADDVREITIAPVLADMGRSGRDAAPDEREVERLAYGVRTAAIASGLDVVVIADTVAGRGASDIGAELSAALSFGSSSCVAIEPTADREELDALVTAARNEHDLVFIVWPQSLTATELLPTVGVDLGILAVVTRGHTPVSSLVTLLRAAEAREIDVLGVVTVGSKVLSRSPAATAIAEPTTS